MTTEIDNADPRSPSDAELLTAVAAGDEHAYGVLWSRHEVAARRFAAQLTRPSNVEDLVSESFARVLRAVKDGGGPESAFRAYLFNTIRRFNIDTGRSYHQRVALTGDDALLDIRQAASAADELAIDVEGRAAWQAWDSLPDESRTLLWHLIIEEETPAQIAPLLGCTPNGVSSRAVRAKERLRQAFLSQHLASTEDESCRSARSLLGGYVRNALSTRDRAKVDVHVEECHRCAAAMLEIRDVNSTLRLVIAPIVLGGSAIAGKYLVATSQIVGTASGAAQFGGPLRTLNRMRHSQPSGPASIIAAAGVAAACAVSAAVGITALLVSGSPRSVADPVADVRSPVNYATTESKPTTNASGPAAVPTPPPNQSSTGPAAVPVVPGAGVPPFHLLPTPTVGPGVPAASPVPRPRLPKVTVPSTTVPPVTPPTSPVVPVVPPVPPVPAHTTFSFALPGPEVLAQVTLTLPDGWRIEHYDMNAALISATGTDTSVSVWKVLGYSMTFTVTGPGDPGASATAVTETDVSSQTMTISLT